MTGHPARSKPGNAQAILDAIPFDDDADEPQTWRGVALSAIMDMFRYANDASPERRMVSANAYAEDAWRVYGHSIPAQGQPSYSDEKYGDCHSTEAEMVCAELYQVLGALAFHYDIMDHNDVIRALDNASDAKMTHKDLLPWPKGDLPAFPPQESSASHNEIVEQCIDAAFNAYAEIDQTTFVVEGPAGIAKRMIRAIRTRRIEEPAGATAVEDRGPLAAGDNNAKSPSASSLSQEERDRG